MIYIGTHIMPHEVGEFRHQVRLHRLTLSNLEKTQLENFTLLPTLNLDDNIIDWKKSKLSKEYYIEHFKISCKTLEGIIDVKPRIGGVSSTTEALKKNIDEILTQDDHYLWIDPDISYSYNFWMVIYESYNMLKDNQHFIVTPSATKLWDRSWDVLVNEDQKDLPYNYEGWFNSNFEEYFSQNKNPELIPTQTVKLGGGFGNLFSAKTLKLIGIPNDYILYGGIDTYIMIGAEALRKKHQLTQYRIKNSITIQDFQFSDKKMYKDFTPLLLNKDDQRIINEKKENIFQKSVKELLTKLNNL